MVCQVDRGNCFLPPSSPFGKGTQCVGYPAQSLNHKIENPGIPASQAYEFRDDIEGRKERKKVTLM